MKMLCLSGGGSKGSYVGGMLEYMKLVVGKEYDTYLGTSTGSILQMLSSVNDFEGLKEGYTSITLDDIYTSSPFKKSKDPENPKMNLLGIAKMHFIEKEPTFGDSHELKNLIRKFFPKNMYEQSITNGKNMISCVTNLSTAETEYYSSKELGIDGYEEFIDWVWVSANATPFASLIKKGGDCYADGGFTEHMPIRKAIEMGATEIDAISTQPISFGGDEDINFGNNPLSLLERMFSVLLWESSRRDIEVVEKMALDRNITLNIYYMPRNLTNNSMYFDKEVMSGWWDEGYEHAKEIFNTRKGKSKKINHVCCKQFKLKKNS